MKSEKFVEEIDILKKFFIIYCKDKHKNQTQYIYQAIHKNTKIDIDCMLCDECKILLTYACQHLSVCPHEIKPRCRKCPNPCYEKAQWKSISKIMKYSGMKCGLLKVKKMFTF